MSALRFSGAVIVGLFLAAVPFLRYVHFGAAAAAHTDHEPRYGGQLAMVGDHHIEVRRRHGLVEAFVSDATRRPVRAEQGWVVFDDKRKASLSRQGSHLVGADEAGARRLEVTVGLADGTQLKTIFDFAEGS